MLTKQSSGYFLTIALSLGRCSCAGLRGYPDEVVSASAINNTCTLYNGTDVVQNYVNQRAVPSEQRSYLDAVMYCRVAEIDANYNDFKRQLSNENNAWNLGSDAALLGLTGATTVAAGTTVKSILGAASTGLTGTKTAADKDLFYEKTMPATIAQMDADRLTAYNTMLEHQIDAKKEKKKDSSAPSYSMAQLLRDLKAYEDAGSLNGAIVSIGNSAGDQKKTQHKNAAANAETLATM